MTKKTSDAHDLKGAYVCSTPIEYVDAAGQRRQGRPAVPGRAADLLRDITPLDVEHFVALGAIRPATAADLEALPADYQEWRVLERVAWRGPDGRLMEAEPAIISTADIDEDQAAALAKAGRLAPVRR